MTYHAILTAAVFLLIARFRPFRHWLDDAYEATCSQFKVLVLDLTFAVRGFFSFCWVNGRSFRICARSTRGWRRGVWSPCSSSWRPRRPSCYPVTSMAP